MTTRPEPLGSTIERILDAAEQHVQVVGFNGFSYADIARELGVTNASIHYHFPGKTDLGVRLVQRYTERFFDVLAKIGSEPGAARDRLSAYVELYKGVLAADRLCLCGMLASEYATLAEPIRAELARFFKGNEDWLGALLEAGRSAHDFEFDGEASAMAMAVVGALEGAMLVARVHGGLEGFRVSSKLILASLCCPVPPRDD